jgi:CubicO group peptidase (beta-lactamase class C family)
MDPARLRHLMAAMQEDIDADRYLGGVIAIGRHGKLALHQAIGHADADRKRPVKKDSVFSLFSVTKAITVVLVLRAIERGQLALTTPISDVVPEFSGRGREAITIYHLLTHSSGLPSVYSAREGMYIDRLDEVVAEICKNVFPEEPPGLHVKYAPLAHHALMGDALRRIDPKKRSYRQIVNEDLLKPLGMKDTAVGLRKDLRKRHLVPVFRGNSPTQHLGHSNLGPNGAFEEELAEMPWVGIVSTAADMYRFAEMLRRGGELNGARILSPTMVARARHCWTWRQAQRTLPQDLRGARVGGAAGLHWSRFYTAWRPHGSCALRHAHFAGDFRQPRRRDDALLGRSGARHVFCRPHDRVMNSDVNLERWQRLCDIAVFGGDVMTESLRLCRGWRGHRWMCPGRPLVGGSEELGVPARGGWRGSTSVHPDSRHRRRGNRATDAELAIHDGATAKLNNRRIPLPRGHVVGGSGSINGMVYFRGMPRDFDDWAAMGNPGWSYREVLPYFIAPKAMLTMTRRITARTGRSGQSHPATETR